MTRTAQVTDELIPMTGVSPRAALAAARSLLAARPGPRDASIAHQAAATVLRDFGDVSAAIREFRLAARMPRVRLPAPLAAVLPDVPVLLVRRIGEVVVHVLGSAVGPARQRSRSEANDAGEAPDGQEHCGDEQESLPPRHRNHHDSCCTARYFLPGGSSRNLLSPDAEPTLDR
jgi:hypothetical protein